MPPRGSPIRLHVRDQQGLRRLRHLQRRMVVGGIHETRGGPENLRWLWSMTVNGPITRSDRVATLEEAKAQFQKSWDAWKAWTTA